MPKEIILSGPYRAGLLESFDKKEKPRRYVRFVTEKHEYEVCVTELACAESGRMDYGKTFYFKAVDRHGLGFSGQVEYSKDLKAFDFRPGIHNYPKGDIERRMREMKIISGPSEAAARKSLETQDDLYRVLFVVLDYNTGARHDLYITVTSMELENDDGCGKTYEITGQTLHNCAVSGHCTFLNGTRAVEGSIQFD